MRSFIIFSALLVILVQCGYPPIPEYPTAPCYPIPSSYPHIPTYPSVPAPFPVLVAEESEEAGFFEEGGHSEFRKRAKARSAHNRKFQRRPLAPIRRFKLKKQ